jgi:hypothetical protein
MGFALSLRVLLSYSTIGADCFQGGHHLVRSNNARIISHSVDFTKPPKTISHLFHTLQPYQG